MALVTDKPILELLRIDDETPLEVRTDGKRLIIAPATASARRKKFDEAQLRRTGSYDRASSVWLNEAPALTRCF